MNKSYDPEYLEKEWSRRDLDLFPYMEGFFSLLRSREENLERTRKRLQGSSAATIVQFLSSDDKDVSLIAKSLIQDYPDQALITSTLVYSLSKITKAGYPARAGACLAGCHRPAAGLAYLFSLLRHRPEIKSRGYEFFNHFWLTGTSDSITCPEHLQHFFRQIFQAVQEDLREIIADLSRISTGEEFLLLKEDLLPAIRAYYLIETRPEVRIIFDQELARFGQQRIRSLGRLISFEPHKHGHHYLEEMLPLVVAFIGLLRLERDSEQLSQILMDIALAEWNKPLRTRLEILIKKVLSLLEDSTLYVYETLAADLFFNQSGRSETPPESAAA
ncbi:MAG: hypothetical protein K6U11_11165 [bacterium]|nr:hypothetical protein [bacterium]